MASPKGLQDIMEASSKLQMIDLKDNFDLVTKTNHKSLNRVIKHSNTMEQGLIKNATQPSAKIIKGINERIQEIEYLSKDKSKIIVDLGPQL